MASRKIEDLCPEIQKIYALFEENTKEAGINYILTNTLRTQKEQDDLYKQGRDPGHPGPIVTWTRKSKHVEGKAFDIAIVKNGKISWNPKDYMEIGKIGMEAGLSWGGAWAKSKDYPHFELKEN